MGKTWIEDCDEHSKEYDRGRKEDADRFDKELDDYGKRYDDELRRNYRQSND